MQITNEKLRGRIKEFYGLYLNRPIAVNRGGMLSPQMFPSWYVLKVMQPEYIIESGVFQGQGTYFFRKACPEAKIICIEPRPEQIIHRDLKAEYYKEDFKDIDWDKIIPVNERENTLLHFDDHQNAFERIKHMKKLGFKYVMFEDNYPKDLGDCYSLKKIWMENGENADYLRENLNLYYEFPPIFKLPKTRWGIDWDEKLPTPEPLYIKDGVGYENWMALFVGEAPNYLWICFVELK